MKHHFVPVSRSQTVVAATIAAGLFAVTSGSIPMSSAAAGVPHLVHPSPSHFTRGHVDNPWFPLKPGTRLIYRGTEEGAHTRDVQIATYRTKVIDGVICRVVFDRVWRNGRLRIRPSSS